MVEQIGIVILEIVPNHKVCAHQINVYCWAYNSRSDNLRSKIACDFGFKKNCCENFGHGEVVLDMKCQK